MYGVVKKLPFVRGFTYSTPPYHIGSVLENQIGLQIFRVMSKYVLWKSRKNYVTEEIQGYIRVLAETQICVKPNTLVIANNMGFHRRGEFTCDTPRKALLINFRNSEKPVW